MSHEEWFVDRWGTLPDDAELNMSKLAWDHQQEIIDDLQEEDRLHMEVYGKAVARISELESENKILADALNEIVENQTTGEDIKKVYGITK